MVHMLGRQTLYCLSRLSVNAGPMLVRMSQLGGAAPKLLSCESPLTYTLMRIK
jgi:hypothetical protein